MNTVHIPHLQNRFNAAAWQTNDSCNVVLMLREVQQGSVDDTPDRGKIIQVIMDHKRQVVKEETVWQPTDDSQHLEDPRALVLPDGSVLVGLTAVRKVSDKFLPYPAFAKVSTREGRTEIDDLVVADHLGQGKNLTPFDSETWVFRRDDQNHQLTIVSWDGKSAKAIGEIDFRQHIPTWASFRMGTTISPIQITQNEYLMIIHGIRFENGIYHYSIGRAKIVKTRGFEVLAVDERPIITPEDFYVDGAPIYPELHDFRRVVYVCGGVRKKVGAQDLLALYVNVGDRQTVEVVLQMKKLLSGWWN